MGWGLVSSVRVVCPLCSVGVGCSNDPGTLAVRNIKVILAFWKTSV